MYANFNKSVSKLNISDFTEFATRLAKKDKGVAMDLYGDPMAYIRKEFVEEGIFTRGGKLTPRGLAELRQNLVDDVKDTFNLSKKQSKKLFNEVKIADLMPGITKSSNISTEELLSKKLCELEASDFGKYMEQIARVDKDLALEIYGSKADDIMYENFEDMRKIFLPTGKMAPKEKTELLASLSEAFGLSPEAAKNMTVKDLLEYANMFGIKR